MPDDHGRDAAAAWIESEPTRRDGGVSLDLAIFELGEPEVILGEVGITMAEPAKRWCELGFWLFPGVRGEGRATLAVDAFTDWLLNVHDIKRVFARIHPDNPRSAAVVERAGFQRAGELPDGTVVWVADQPPPL